jgi:hypothetical protein
MRGEQGFVLVTALLIMLVLTIIGIAVTTNTSIELQVAGNDKVHKKTFYEAEAGAMLGVEVIEQNLNCSTGFSGQLLEGEVFVQEKQMWRNKPLRSDSSRSICSVDFTDPAYYYQADAIRPWDGNGTPPAQEVNLLYIGGVREMLAGGSLQMASGYEGTGKSAAKGGVARVYDIYSRFDGLNGSQSIVVLGWRHVVGSEGSCKY